MAGGNQNLQRIRAIAESSFGADMSATIVASGFEVKAHPSQPDVQTTMLKDESNRQRSWEDRVDIVGPQGADFPLKMYLAGSGLPLDAAAAVPSVPRTSITKMFKSVLGGWVSEKGDTAGSGSTTAIVKSTTGSRFIPGGAIVVPTGTAGALEMREIASKATNDLTLKTLTSNALATSGAIHNCETVYPHDHASITDTLAFLVESVQRKDVWWLRGCQAAGGFSLELPQNDKAACTFAMKAAGFYHDTEAGTPVAGSLGSATYTDGNPPVFMKSEILWGTAGNTARAPLNTYSIKLAPSWGFESIPSVSGLNGQAGWFPMKGEPLMTFELEIGVDSSAPYDETAIKTELIAQTKKQLFVQIGNTAGNIVGISLPCVQITAVKRSAVGTRRGWVISGKVLEDENCTDKSTALRAAPFRFHFA